MKKLFWGLALLIVAAALGASLYFSSVKNSGMVATPLPPSNEAQDVGVLIIAPGSLLRIRAPEFSAELDAQGKGTIVKMDMTRSPAVAGARIPVTLDGEVYRRLLENLGTLKAAWSARKAGEAALSPDLRLPPEEELADESNPSIVIEEVASDGKKRLVLQLTVNSAEFAETNDALTPLRLLQN